MADIAFEHKLQTEYVKCIVKEGQETYCESPKTEVKKVKFDKKQSNFLYTGIILPEIGVEKFSPTAHDSNGADIYLAAIETIQEADLICPRCNIFLKRWAGGDLWITSYIPCTSEPVDVIMIDTHDNEINEMLNSPPKGLISKIKWFLNLY